MQPAAGSDRNLQLVISRLHAHGANITRELEVETTPVVTNADSPG